jgi:segregation and condensation protein B
MELKQILEALLFSAHKPLTVKEIRAIFAEATAETHRNVRESQLVSALQALKTEYDSMNRSFQLVEIANGWRIQSRPEFGPWLKQLHEERPARLSLPALETLAIIAIRQPITRADIAAIRGVDVDGVIKTLLERDLITVVGRSEEAGKPILYGTTERFLEHFGLPSIEDVPRRAELAQQVAALMQREQKISTENEQKPAENPPEN